MPTPDLKTAAAKPTKKAAPGKATPAKIPAKAPLFKPAAKPAAKPAKRKAAASRPVVARQVAWKLRQRCLDLAASFNLDRTRLDQLLAQVIAEATGALDEGQKIRMEEFGTLTPRRSPEGLAVRFAFATKAAAALRQPQTEPVD